MKSYVILIALILGIAVGVAVSLMGPDYIKAYLPAPAGIKAGGVEGKVVAKALNGGKLLMTFHTNEGATLVTFNKKVAEINLLIEKGDTVTLGIRAYRPFITNPSIKRVMKGEEALTPSPEPTAPAEATPAPSPEAGAPQEATPAPPPEKGKGPAPEPEPPGKGTEENTKGAEEKSI